MEKLTTFGQTMRRQRRLMDLTQEALSERSGISETHIKRLEKGIPDPGMRVIFALSSALEMEPGALLHNAYQEWRLERKKSLQVGKECPIDSHDTLAPKGID